MPSRIGETSDSSNAETYRGVRNDLFRPTGLDRGRSTAYEVIWYVFKILFIQSPWPWPSRIKAGVLRMFGAKIGKGLYIRPRVNVHFPWKLVVGDYCWLGDGCELLNLEPITLGDHVTIGHQAFLAAGSHDIGSRSMAYANRPITVHRGTWVSTRAFVGPGVTVGENCVIGACAVVLKDVPNDSVVGTTLGQVIRKRELTRP